MSEQEETVAIPEAIDIAMQHHQEGRLYDAEILFWRILETQPNQPIALHFLGIIAHQVGNNEVAVEYITKALDQKPDYAEAHNNLGNALRALGNIEGAVNSYQRGLQLKPGMAETHNNLGVALLDLGSLDDAISNFQKAVVINPDYGEAHNNLGLTLYELGSTAEAEESYRKALIIMPDRAEIHFNLGNLMRGTTRLDQAQASFQNALSLKSDYPEAHYNLGLVLHDLGKLEEAATHYEKALALQPESAEIYNDLGNTVWALGDAETAAANYRKALSLEPNYPEAHNNLAVLYQIHRRFEEAHTSIQKALSLRPRYADAYNTLANILCDQGRVNEAIPQLDVAISHKPKKDGWRIKRSLLLPIIPSSTQDIEDCRANLSQAIENLQKTKLSVSDPILEVGMTNFFLAYHNRNNKVLMEKIATFYIKTCPKLSFESKHCLHVDKNKKEKLRVGFISSYFWEHTIGKLTWGIIQNLSRKHFEIIVFRPSLKKDAISEKIDQSADKVVLLSGSLEQDQNAISNEKVDILFYPDIGMSVLTYFLAFARLAPVQAVSWGHPDTTGIPNIDYFLSSELLESPVSSDHYSEQLVKLKSVPTYYFQPKPLKGRYDRIDFTLPNDVRLYVCPQALFKFHPTFDDILKELIQRDPDGRIVLINDTLDGSYKKLLLKRWTLKYPEIIPNTIFVPRMSQEKFIGLLTVADALLDIPSFSGGNSSLEAFSVGAPIVTWPQNFMRSRVTSAFYKQMGLTKLIARDSASYVDLALKLAQDKNFYRQMQNDIKANVHRLYETSATIREIETFFLDAHEAWRTGNVP